MFKKIILVIILLPIFISCAVNQEQAQMLDEYKQFSDDCMYIVDSLATENARKDSIINVLKVGD